MDLGFAGATADELSGCGSPDAFGVVADTTNPARVEAAFAELGERWNGELNVLINTVGLSASGTFEQLTDEPVAFRRR